MTGKRRKRPYGVNGPAIVTEKGHTYYPGRPKAEADRLRSRAEHHTKARIAEEKRAPLTKAEAILEKIRHGAPVEVAAKSAGVSRLHLVDALNRGIADLDAGQDTEYARLYAAVVDAEGEAEKAMSDSLYRAGLKGNVRAALEWLKRRHPTRWGDRLLLQPGTYRHGRYDPATEAMFRKLAEEFDRPVEEVRRAYQQSEEARKMAGLLEAGSSTALVALPASGSPADA